MTNKEFKLILSNICGQENTIAVPKILLSLVEDGNQAIMLSQLLYWCGKQSNPDGWIYKSYDELSTETGLTHGKLRTAKNNLLKKELINCKVKKIKGLNTLHYKLADNLLTSLNKVLNARSSIQKSSIQHSETLDPAFRNARSSISNKALDYSITLESNTSKEYSQNNTSKAIFDLWNKSEIIFHAKLTNKIKIAISSVLQLVSTDQFCNSIKNYGIVVNSEEYYFKQRWTMMQFINTGLGNNSGFTLFLDSSHPLERFKARSTEEEFWKLIRSEFKSVTENYDQIADFDKNLYYGFELDSIKKPWDIILSVQDDMKRLQNWDYSHFWQLELCVAAFIWHRKNELNKEQVQRFFDKWKELKDNFKEV